MLGRTVGNRNCHADKVQGGPAGTVILCTGTTSCTPPSTGTRVAYSELLADERKETAAAFWIRANRWFNQCAIAVRKVLTDNGSSVT
jgi:hypothetical protein